MPDQSSQPQRATPFEVYSGLRNQVFQNSREKLGLPATPQPTEPWGVVMDLGWPKATVTVMALASGDASIYLSTGGGCIGGIGKPAIRAAGQNFVKTASEFQPMMQSTTEYPLPQVGEARFYVLTNAGVFTTSIPEEHLRQQRHPLVRLYAAGQQVIAQYRLDQETSGK